jgi:proteasome lid subunit RPN8/RPN11
VPASIRIRAETLAAMVNHSQRQPQQECCGLLAGRDALITRAFPAANVAPNPATSYEIAPQEIFDLMREMRRALLDFLGIYHSHPAGDNAPSPRDIDRAYYPDVAYFILSPSAAAPAPVRAFAIRDARASELSIEVVSSE